jgi:hypothetical protein
MSLPFFFGVVEEKSYYSLELRLKEMHEVVKWPNHAWQQVY